MLNIPDTIIDHAIAPIVAAQFFVFVLIYFTIMRRRLVAEYPLYLCFLVSFIFFLLARPIQEFYGPEIYAQTLFIRMFILFAVGSPSLLLVALARSGIRLSRSVKAAPYVIGTLTWFVYCVIHGAADGPPMLFMGMTAESLHFCPFPLVRRSAHMVQLFGALLLLVIPSCYLLARAVRTSGKNRSTNAFQVGILFFGLSMVVGILTNVFQLLYTGAIISACFWMGAVFYDVRRMKGSVGLLREELQALIRSGNESVEPKVGKLLADLEELSHGNVDVYKMRIRDILGMLTDTMIEAGGDSNELVQRNSERVQAVDASSDPQVIHEIICSEAVALSGLIADIPEKRVNESIDRAKKYIHAHYAENIGVAEIAESLELSQGHIMREFKKATGQTLNQYLTQFRIGRAKELLAEKSVTDTAFEVGYNNSNYFSTVFKKQTGQTPAQFRKTMDDQRR